MQHHYVSLRSKLWILWVESYGVQRTDFCKICQLWVICAPKGAQAGDTQQPPSHPRGAPWYRTHPTYPHLPWTPKVLGPIYLPISGMAGKLGAKGANLFFGGGGGARYSTGKTFFHTLCGSSKCSEFLESSNVHDKHEKKKLTLIPPPPHRRGKKFSERFLWPSIHTSK